MHKINMMKYMWTKKYRCVFLRSNTSRGWLRYIYMASRHGLKKVKLLYGLLSLEFH